MQHFQLKTSLLKQIREEESLIPEGFKFLADKSWSKKTKSGFHGTIIL